MTSSKCLLPKFSVLFCQGNHSECKFSISPVAPALPPQKARLEGLVRHNRKVQECVFSLCSFLPSSETLIRPKEMFFAVGNGAFAILIDGHRSGLYWDAIVALYRLPQLMWSYLYHQNKFVLELLAVILEHRILNSCIFLLTCLLTFSIQWILGLSLSFGSSLPSLSVKVACVLSGLILLLFLFSVKARQGSPCSISKVLLQGDIQHLVILGKSMFLTFLLKPPAFLYRYLFCILPAFSLLYYGEEP